MLVAAAGAWWRLRGERIPVVWRVESDGVVAGWAADGESFYVVGPLPQPTGAPARLRRHARSDGRLLAEVALPAGVSASREPNVLELPDGRLAVLEDRLYVGTFADGLGEPAVVEIEPVAAPNLLFPEPPRLAAGGKALLVPWLVADPTANFKALRSGVTRVRLPGLETESWSTPEAGWVAGVSADGESIAVMRRRDEAGEARFFGAAVRRDGTVRELDEMFGNVVPWNDECLVGVGPGFDFDSAEKLRLRAVPLDGSPPVVLHGGVVSTQPTATIRRPAGHPGSGWYFFAFVDYEGSGNAVYFPAAHRYLAHVAGDPLRGGRADRVIHEVRRDVQVRGRNFGDGWTMTSPHFGPGGRWLLMDHSDGSIELVDLSPLLP